MNTALNLITAASFLAHMVVGCCWHHPHDAAGHACDSAGIQFSATDCGSHDHHHVDQQSGEHQEEVPHEDCDGETCVAVYDIQLNFDLGGNLLSAPVALTSVSVDVLSPCFADALHPEIDTGPQLRPHLAHQILLI